MFEQQMGAQDLILVQASQRQTVLGMDRQRRFAAVQFFFFFFLSSKCLLTSLRVCPQGGTKTELQPGFECLICSLRLAGYF